MKISQINLFQNMNDTEIVGLKENGFLRHKSYDKGERIFNMGDVITETGAVLSGGVVIQNIDFLGNTSVITQATEGQLFAETYALSGEPMMVEAICKEHSEILFVNIKNMLMAENSVFSWYNKFCMSLMNITARKNIELSRRIFCTSPKKVRTRVIIYLSEESVKANSSEFEIPFNRRQMADYLNLDRSALSKELCKMRDEKIISFNKNHFKLLKNKSNSLLF